MTPDCCPTRTAADRVADAVICHVYANQGRPFPKLPHRWNVSTMLLDMLAHIDGGHVDEHFVAWANEVFPPIPRDDHPSLTDYERTPVKGLNPGEEQA